MSRRRPSRFNGLLPVYKQAGPTSHDVVDMARKALRERRIGHTGTLDPLAEGLLLLCVGQATRLQQYLLMWDKTYQGEVQLGHATTTYDSEGEESDPRGTPPPLDEDVIERLTTRFSGEIEQVPPPYSAKKIHGKKLYELARNGEPVSPEPKVVRVEQLEIEVSAPDRLKVEATTSTGFYVRSLAHDIGHELGCGGFLRHLRRSSVGPYLADDALDQTALEEADASPAATGWALHAGGNQHSRVPADVGLFPGHGHVNGQTSDTLGLRPRCAGEVAPETIKKLFERGSYGVEGPRQRNVFQACGAPPGN